MKLRRFHICVVLLLLSRVLSAQERAADIFVLSTHSQASEWVKSMMTPIEGLRFDRPDLVVNKAFLQLTSHPDVSSLERSRDSVLAAQTLPPRLVILLGGSSYGFAPDVQERWPGIPILLLGENEYYCDLEYTLFGPADPHAKRTFVTAFLDQGINLTLISAPAMIRRTAEMIFHVQPDVEKIFFIGGENYKSRECQLGWEEYMSENHPDIDCQTVLATDTSTDELIALLEANKGTKTAAVYCSWTARKHYRESNAARQQTLSLIESIVPTYSLSINDCERHPYLVGFYSYSFVIYQRIVRQRILDVLDYGIQPSEIPFSNLQTGMMTLNYEAFEHFGLDTSLIPADAVVVNKPLSLWDRKKKEIMWGIFILIVGLGLFIIHSMARSLVHLKRARALAEQANRMKTTFIQNMSDEVQAPLNAIVGYSEKMCAPDGYVTDEEKTEYLSNVLNNTQLLTTMMNDMLTIADMDNKRFAVEPSPTNLNEMAYQAIKTVQLLYPDSVSILRQPGLSDDARYMTDGMRVQQILIAFLSNACKNTLRGAVVFGSSLWEHPGKITFYVTDTGPGIPKDMAEAIFYRFGQQERQIVAGSMGMGFCKMMAQSLGGDVWLDTHYTDGARFVLVIPKVEA